MRNIKVELAIEELTLLTSLASDQLFRREFIDPKMPGYHADPAEVHVGKALVDRLRQIITEANRGTGSAPSAVNGRVAGSPSRRSTASTDAV